MPLDILFGRPGGRSRGVGAPRAWPWIQALGRRRRGGPDVLAVLGFGARGAPSAGPRIARKYRRGGGAAAPPLYLGGAAGKRISGEELERIRESYRKYMEEISKYRRYKFYEGPIESILHYPALDLGLRGYQAKRRIADILHSAIKMRAKPMIRYIDSNRDGFAECIKFEMYDQNTNKKIGEKMVCS